MSYDEPTPRRQSLREIPLRQSNTSAAAAALGEGLSELTAEEDQELSAMHGQPAMSDKPA